MIFIANFELSKCKNGFIHTLELRLYERDNNDIYQDFVDKSPPKRIARHPIINTNRRFVSLAFNPNNEATYLKQSGRWSYDYECFSLAKLNDIIRDWAAQKSANNIRYTRADFAIDCINENEAAMFKKFADLLISTFVLKNRIKRKDQFFTSDIIKRRPKLIGATHKPFDFTCYSKAIQNPSSNVFWRLELRYKTDLRRKEMNLMTIEKMLAAIQTEIKSLSAFYDETINKYACQLAHEFLNLQGQCKEKLSPYQFLSINEDRVFARDQVRQFFKAIGTTNELTEHKIKHFTDYYKNRLFVSKTNYKKFLSAIVNEISNYMKTPEKSGIFENAESTHLS